MAIIVHYAAGNSREIVSTPYKNERELEDVLAAHPGLLQGLDSEQLFFVERQLHLENAGKIDLLLTTDEGLPVVVEVKLARNAEARRQIVAQIFDYVADLTLLDFWQLDTLVDGALEKVIEDVSAHSESRDLRKDFANHLRSGETRFILAVDETPDDLLRIMEFLCRHTNLDVRLIEIRKFEEGPGHVTHVPTVKVERSSEGVSTAVRQSDPEPPNPAFKAFFDAMRTNAPRLAPRPSYRYAVVNLPKGCQVRYDILVRQKAVRVSFKSWDLPAAKVREAVEKVFPTWKEPILDHYKLEILVGQGDIISYATSIPLLQEGGLDSSQVRDEASRLFNCLLQRFSAVVEELGR